MTASPAGSPLALLRREDDRGVVTLTLTTPRNRNALSLEMIEALIAAFAEIAMDEKARVVVFAGEGPALSAGHDLREMQAHRNDPDRGNAYYEQLMARCSVLMQAIVALPKPVIAAVEGVATAAGCQLVASCDLAIAGERRALRPLRRQQRVVLFDAAGRGRADPVAQACDGDGDDGKTLQRRPGRTLRSCQ